MPARSTHTWAGSCLMSNRVVLFSAITTAFRFTNRPANLICAATSWSKRVTLWATPLLSINPGRCLCVLSGPFFRRSVCIGPCHTSPTSRVLFSSTASRSRPGSIWSASREPPVRPPRPTIGIRDTRVALPAETATLSFEERGAIWLEFKDGLHW